MQSYPLRLLPKTWHGINMLTIQMKLHQHSNWYWCMKPIKKKVWKYDLPISFKTLQQALAYWAQSLWSIHEDISRNLTLKVGCKIFFPPSGSRIRLQKSLAQEKLWFAGLANAWKCVPLVFMGTQMRDLFLCARPWLVLARRHIQSAWAPFVIQSFVPLIMRSSPLLSAFV